MSGVHRLTVENAKDWRTTIGDRPLTVFNETWHGSDVFMTFDRAMGGGYYAGDIMCFDQYGYHGPTCTQLIYDPLPKAEPTDTDGFLWRVIGILPNGAKAPRVPGKHATEQEAIDRASVLAELYRDHDFHIAKIVKTVRVSTPKPPVTVVTHSGD